MPYLWIFYGIYFLTKLVIKRVKFIIIKRHMTQEEINIYAHNQVRAFAKELVDVTGSTVNVVGEENIPEGTCVFVGNHQANYDILVTKAYIKKPVGFIAKKELEKFFAVNYWMKQIHCVFMDRKDPRDSVKAIVQGVENIKNGISMAIYPEGTRSKGPEMGEFKKGAMKLATKPGVPIVPVTINNTYEVFEAQGGKRVKATKIDLIFSKPIETKNLSKEEQNDLSERIKAIIQENLDKLNAK